MIPKRDLTEKFLSQLDLPKDEKTFKKHHLMWWMNPRASHANSYRLTDAGFIMMTEKLEYASYKVAFPPETEWNSQLILRLDKFLDSPYYIEKKHIIVFRQKTAVELVLFGGDITKYGWAKDKANNKPLDN